MLEHLISALLSSASAGAGPTKTYLGTIDFGNNTATHTFSGVGIGVPAEDRLVVVVASTYTSGTSGVCSSITIGGVSATRITATNPSGFRVRTVIAYLRVPTGTAADIVVSWPSSGAGAISVYTITGQSSDTPNDADTLASTTDATRTITLTPAAGSVGIMGAVKSTAGTAFGSTTWPVDAEIQTNPATCRVLHGSKDELTTSETVSVSGGVQICVSGATWR